MTSELVEKLERIRGQLSSHGFDALHVAHPANLAWLLCGADVTVSQANSAVAEAIVTERSVTVLAAEVERHRLEDEELPDGPEVVYYPWFEQGSKRRLIDELTSGLRVLSDTPGVGFEEQDLWPLRCPLMPIEVDRYRQVSRAAAEAFSDVLTGVKPGLSEWELAGRLCEALVARALIPSVLLVASDERLEMYKHPLPSTKRVERRLMAVTCARRHGLYANATRLVSFGETPQKRRAYRELLAIEADIISGVERGGPASDLFTAVQEAYRAHGHNGAWRHHHQGGPTGYRTRDFILDGTRGEPLPRGAAYAVNPSLAGLKVEDTVLLEDGRVDVLTRDAIWPTRLIDGRPRPEVLEV